MASDGNQRVAIVAVGTMVPDIPAFHGPAFNRAAQMLQTGLIRGLINAAMPVTAILSIEPLPAVPRARRLFGRRGLASLGADLPPVRMVSFVNVHPLKALTAGLGVFLRIVRWSWRHRGQRRIVHLFNMTMPPGIFVWLAARLTGSRLSVTTMDVWRPGGGLVPDSMWWRLDFALQKRLLPRFDGHMVVSRAMAEDLLPGKRVCLIEGAVASDWERVAPPPRREPRQRFRVVLAGTLTEHNGVELALDATSALPEDVELVVAGAGPLADRVRERAERDARIIDVGFVSFEDLVELYASADLLLNIRVTTTLDTRYFFPSKLFELLASGTPVLSTCVGHLEEEYGRWLYLLREETPHALAARIRGVRAIDRAVREDLGRRARDFVLREKTWDRQGQRFASYLREHVLGEAG